MSDAVLADPMDFDLPYLDADRISEAGLILMGLDAERVLAVLGTATLVTDLGAALLAVDAAWHAGEIRVPLATAVRIGAEQWRQHRPALARHDDGRPRSGAPREAWASAHAVATAVLPAATGPTVAACVAVCWFRREEFDEVTRV